MSEPEAAVAIVQTREPEQSILLMRRAEHEHDPWSGQWSLPGGRRDATDHDLVHTALRELEEECGIRLTRDDMVAALPSMIARRRSPPYVLVAPFLFQTDRELATILDYSEAVEAIWIPIRILRDPSHHALRAVPGRPPNMLFPGVELSRTPVWGFTYRLLMDWLGFAQTLEAGSAAAGRVLDFLVQHGLSLHRPWQYRQAAVAGKIPVAEALAHFSASSHFLPGVNCLIVRPDLVRLIGPADEEYDICVV